VVRVIVRAPNHLGDGVLALPAISALAHRFDAVHIQAPAWGADLYRDLPATVVERGPMPACDAAVLLAPSLRAAWQARRARRRIGLATDARGALLTDVVVPCTHRGDTYARIAAALGVVVEGAPAWARRAEDPVVDVPDDHVGLVPVSPSGAVVMWPGFAALAARRGPVVVYGGPGEQAAVRAAVPTGDHRVGLSLPAFAAALARCRVLVANDSGAAHFARACGVPTVVVFGSTTAARTGAHGAVAVEGPSLPCRPCYRKRCSRGDVACLDIAVDRVERAVTEAAGG
jgi:ADP-heptose:LPS heptosyltransferase